MSQELLARPVTPVVEAVVGQPLTLPVAVFNGSGTSLWISIQVDLPPGWRLLFQPAPRRLDSGQESVILLTLVVPATAHAGSYSLPVNFSESGEVLAVTRFEVDVAELHRIEAVVIEAPRLALDDRYQVVFALRNSGNVSERVVVDVTEQQGFSVLLTTPDEIYLEPQGLTGVRVTVTPPSDLPSPVTHAVTLYARTSRDGPVVATATASVEVMAVRQPTSMAYRMLDLDVDASVSLDIRNSTAGLRRTHPAFGVGIRGSGQLFEDDDEVTLSLTAESDAFPEEFVATYRNREFALVLGNQEKRQTFLLPPAEGFGLLLSTPGDRWREPRGQIFALTGERFSTGISLSEEVADGFEVTLQTRLAEGGAHAVGGVGFYLENDERRRLSVRAEQGLDLATLAPGWNLELEAGGADYGVKADWSYTARGYRDNASAGQSYGAGLNVRLADGPLSEVRGDYREIKLVSGEFQRGATVEMKGWQSDSNWSVRYLYNATLNSSAPSKRQDLRFRSSVDLSANTTLQPMVWWERTDDLGEGGVSETMGVEVELELAVADSALSPGLQFEYGLDKGSVDSLGLTLGWQGKFAGTTELRFHGSVGVIGDEPLELWAEGSHGEAGGPRLRTEVQARIDGRGLQRMQAQLGMRVPFAVPTARRSDVGNVSGSVIDGSEHGVAGIVVWLAGFTSVTRADGSFEFPAIPPGRHAVALRGVGPGRVVMPELPHVIEVEATTSPRIDLQIFRASEVAAKASVREVEPERPSGESGGVVGLGESGDDGALLQGLVLLLEGPSGQQRSLLGRDGTVRFTHLPPGNWTLRIAEGSVPEYYRVEPAELTIELAEGTVEEVEFELVPVVRRIRFQDGGVVGN